jgi:hypothetical protein
MEAVAAGPRVDVGQSMRVRPLIADGRAALCGCRSWRWRVTADASGSCGPVSLAALMGIKAPGDARA